MSKARALGAKLWRWLHRSTLVILLLFLLVSIFSASATYFVLNTESGTQWALQITHRLLPELAFTEIQGSFLRGVRAEEIRWRDADVDVELSQVQLRLRFPHLLHGEINLAKLHADTLRISLIGSSNDSPVKLPRLFLPFILSTPDLAVRNLEIIDNGSLFSLHDIRSAIRWRATTLRFSRANVRWNEVALNADGAIGFRGDYPLRATGLLTTPQWPNTIAVSSSGDLRQLKLQINSEKPYKAKGQITLATLDKNFPLQIQVALGEPVSQTFAGTQVAIEKAVLDANGDLTQIQAQLALTAKDSRYGDSQLKATAHWRDNNFDIDTRWLPATGELQLHCSGSLQTPISAICDGKANTLAMTPWLNGQKVEISSDISIKTKWLDPQWSLALALPNITGKYNGESIKSTLDLNTDDGAQWQLRQLTLNIGNNTVSAKGEFGKRYHLRGDIRADNLAQLDPRLGGALTGYLTLGGNNTPAITGRLRGSHLRWNDVHATSSALELNLAALGKASSSVLLEIQQLARGDSNAVNLIFNANGRAQQQRWSLSASHRQQRAALACETQSSADWQNWQLLCNDFSGEFQRDQTQNTFTWHNTAAIRGIAQFTQKRFELSPFCLTGDGAEFCLDKMLSIVDNKPQTVSLHASGLPLRWAQPWFPDAIEVLGDPRLSARLQLHSTTPYDAQADIEIPATRWRWQTLKAVETTELDAAHLAITLNAQRAFFATSLQAARIGRIDAQLAVNDPRSKRELDGRIAIDALQLAGIAWAFTGLDSIDGEINGAVDIGGTASAPQLHGQLLLKDGNALWAPLGAPFRTVHADLTFNNNSAKLGGWFALGQGGGDIDGDIHWSEIGDDWKLRLGLVAGGISAMPLPDSTVVFSPHTELIATPGEVHIDGYVDVASADIQFKQLPPETIDVSQDQEIIGQEIDESAWKLWAELNLNLGDNFHLRGFGADVDLNGRLQLKQLPGDNMHLYGEVKVPHGRYRAYGQRLSVRKGSVIFYGPLDNPDLNLEAIRDMPPGITDVVGLRVIGSLKTPEAVLFSEPAMPDSDIAYYLLTGRKPVASINGTSGYSASGALLSLGLAGSESKAGQLAEKFGITDLQLSTSESKTGESEAEVSGQLGKDLYVRYGRGLGQKSNSIAFQYRLTPKLMIETISGIEDALDLLYSFEIK